jgi:hypothetical protein
LKWHLKLIHVHAHFSIHHISFHIFHKWYSCHQVIKIH